MEIKTEKIYQHYVPKFYLRYFSNDPNSVGTYIFKDKKYIPIAPLHSIAGSKYLYGEDGELENWFSMLESKWNVILKKIIDNENLDINYEEYTYILMFIFLSDARSKINANLMNKFINELAITTFNNDPKNKEKYSYSENVTHLTVPNIHFVEAMPKITPVMFDLNLALIVNKTNNEFITSDCIINKYNQFLLEKGYKRGYGYGTCGIELIVPISPKCCLVLYDNCIYDAKVRNNMIIIKDSKEIKKLNSLFLYNSDKNIFFNRNMHKNKIDILLKKSTRIQPDEDTIFRSEDGEFLIKIGNRCIDKNFDLKFLKTKNSARKVKVNINKSAPMRPYAQMLSEREDKDKTPQEILDKIDGKKFYLETKK